MITIIKQLGYKKYILGVWVLITILFQLPLLKIFVHNDLP